MQSDPELTEEHEYISSYQIPSLTGTGDMSPQLLDQGHTLSFFPNIFW